MQKKDVTDDKFEIKFGKTVIRCAEHHYNLFYGDYSETTHAAIYLGTSHDGTQYTWSKNGSYVIPTITTVKAPSDDYGKIEGYRAEKGGGYYNLNSK